ncbi:MAG: hypothetical protein H8D45_26690 [Bacteroidetes bacterium]|nr:hypothetical protein [Bacteroidota bacterium]
MSQIASTAIIKNPNRVIWGSNVIIMDHVIIGLENYYQDIFENDEQRLVTIEDKVRIYPWTLVYEGATLRTEVIMEERTTVGSRTDVGARSRILYQAQVNDNIRIGHDCIIGAFIADNCKIGNYCSVFGALVHRYSNQDTTLWNETEEQGPILEDRVLVGWGSVIVGNVTIGKGSRIRPNTVVTRDIPAGTVYAG